MATLRPKPRGPFVSLLAVPVALLLLVSACAPAAPPTPTPAPPKPAAPAPAAPPTPAPKPAAPAPTAAPAKPAPTVAPAKPAPTVAPAKPAPTVAPAKPAPTAAAKPAPKTLEKITIRMGWKASGHRAPYFLAVEKGFYAEEGLDVTVGEGNGSLPVLQTIANKGDPFGTGIDGGAIGLGVSQGMPVKVVALMYQKSPTAVFFRADRNIKTAKDLEGKTIGATAGDAGLMFLPAFMKANGADYSKINLISMDIPSRIPAFLAERIIGTTGYSNDSYVQFAVEAKKKGWGADVFIYGDHGVPLIGEGILTHNDLIKEKPQVVRGLVRALLKSFTYAKQNPDEALNALFKHHPTLDREVARESLRMTWELMESPVTKQFGGWGYSTPDQWVKHQDVLAQYSDLKNKVADPNTFFTNEFLK